MRSNLPGFRRIFIGFFLGGNPLSNGPDASVCESL